MTPQTTLQAAAAISPTLYGFILEHRDTPGEYGNLARSIRKDPCFPRPSRTKASETPGPSRTSYVGMLAHLNEVHGGKAQAIDTLTAMWNEWRERWMATGLNPAADPEAYAPRENILFTALDTDLRQGRNGLFYCWNDVPGSPTQGHFNGNKEATVQLYEEDNHFFCHQCGIFGWSDQLRDRDWESRNR